MTGFVDRAKENEEVSLSFERLVFFSDAVFAIVITLLVLPLTAQIDVPVEMDGASRVRGALPHITTFVVTFLVIGQFWIGHHRLFDRFRRFDRGLLWLNLLCLLTVAFLPFPAALLGSQSSATHRFPVVFYAACLTATSLTLTMMWLYAVRRGLVDQSMDPHLAAEFTLRAVLTSAIFLLSVGAAYFLGLLAAFTIWVVLLPAARFLASRRYRASVTDVSEDG